jgi:hypothetical protein
VLLFDLLLQLCSIVDQLRWSDRGASNARCGGGIQSTEEFAPGGVNQNKI